MSRRAVVCLSAILLAPARMAAAASAVAISEGISHRGPGAIASLVVAVTNHVAADSLGFRRRLTEYAAGAAAMLYGVFATVACYEITLAAAARL